MSGHTYRKALRRVLYFFPLQLLLLHLKKNHLLLLCWLLLFGYVTGGLGVKYGIPNLFLNPEYFGREGFWSFAITGFALGGFITAFNLYSYMMHGHRFPFIATLARPFLKFNVNNVIIPLAFLITYCWCSARFQYRNELVAPGLVTLNIAGFLLGVGSFLALALLYFTRTNTDIIKMLGKEPDEYRPTEPLVDIIGPTHDAPPRRTAERRKATRWLRRQQRAEKWRVETYLTPRLRIQLARRSDHYDKELLRDVLWQNHVNGSIFEVVLVLSFIALGAFSDLRLFAIPAAASALLLLTMLLMVISALFRWLQGWGGAAMIGALLVLNALSHGSVRIFHDSQAYGLDYAGPPAVYDLPTIAALANDAATADADARAMLGTLERWKARNDALPHQGGKPPMVLINTSGGGLRSTLWTLRCLQVADSLLGGTLMERTVLITGSSGGLIGAAYYRQLFHADAGNGTAERNSAELLDEVSSDMLNPLAFNFVTNDMFVRYRKVYDGEHRYTLDRGHAFERRLNQNTRGLLDVRMGELAEAERDASIPLLVMSPVSINDGRRVVIGSLPMAFLTDIKPERSVVNKGQPEAIEFGRMFADQGASRLKLYSALRMNATFPYITPVVSLPSEPPMRVMDAGGRDNYGYRTSLVFLRTFRRWVAENTGGVVVFQLRDTQRELEVKPSGTSMIARMLDPVGSVYDNFLRVQDQDYDLMLAQSSAWADFPLRVVDVQLRHGDEDQISLSWHLTALERKRVLRAKGTLENVRAFEEFRAAVLGPSGGAMRGDGGARDPAGDRAPRP